MTTDTVEGLTEGPRNLLLQKLKAFVGPYTDVLLKKPHVAPDNSYGEIRSYLEAWTGASDLVQRANNFTDALSKIDGIVQHAPVAA